jgi:hypothetical protein
VHRRVSGKEPDFVLFIQDLVRLAGGERPSRKVVEISLGNRRTLPMATQKSEQSGV